MHVGGECVGVLLFYLIDRSFRLFLISARQYDVIASLTQIARRLIAKARAGAGDDDHPSRHRLLYIPVINQSITQAVNHHHHYHSSFNLPKPQASQGWVQGQHFQGQGQ